jgi:uncharacterized Tic20 family protein
MTDPTTRSEFLSILGVQADGAATTWSALLEELAAADLSTELALEDSSAELWDGIAELPRVIEAGPPVLGRPAETVVSAAARADGELAATGVRLMVLEDGRTQFGLIAVPSTKVRRAMELARGFGGSLRLISQADVDAGPRQIPQQPSGYVPSAPVDSRFAPGFTPAPGYTAGLMSYGLGFLGWIPIPFVGLIIGGVAMFAARASVSRRGPIAAQNARAAANWGLTIIVAIVALVVLQILLASIAAATDARGFLPTGLPILLILLVGPVHLVVLILGLVNASKGRVFKNPIAIPFLRG